MRENRLYGSEGGVAERSFLPLSLQGCTATDVAVEYLNSIPRVAGCALTLG